MSKNEINKAFKFWLPVLVWASVIFAFSSLTTGSATEFRLADFIIKKTAHFVEYGLLAVLIYRALVNSEVSKPQAVLWAIGISFMYGLSDEFHQSFTPGRMPRFRDVIIDTIGAAASVYFVWKLLPKMPMRLKNWAKNLDLL